MSEHNISHSSVAVFLWKLFVSGKFVILVWCCDRNVDELAVPFAASVTAITRTGDRNAITGRQATMGSYCCVTVDIRVFYWWLWTTLAGVANLWPLNTDALGSLFHLHWVKREITWRQLMIEVRRVWKESVVVSFVVLSEHLPVGLMKTMKNVSQRSRNVSRD